MLDYELLDHGKGLKFERFGAYRLIRPESRATKQPKTPIHTWKEDSACRNLGKGHYEWEPLLKPWVIEYDALKLELRLSQSQNIGIFPEQEANWRWLDQKVHPGMKILNLFAYTGVASLVCAKAGSEVCHVDASKAVVRWASDNARLSGLENKSIRWIVEDAQKFLRREATRGKKYDGIILDPPPFGHASSDDFLFKRDIGELLRACKEVLVQDPNLFLFNSYAMNLKAADLGKLVEQYFLEKKIETGELKIGELSLSTYARF